MKLQTYLDLIKTKPYLWADAMGFARTLVYSWLRAEKPALPNIDTIHLIRRLTDGAVGPDDWGNPSPSPSQIMAEMTADVAKLGE